MSPSTAGPSVAVVDSVVLHEVDSMPLGAYTSFVARAATGELYVNDMQLRRVLHFHANGEFAGVIGRPGSGPGEFNTPGPLHLIANDSLLGVVDVNRLAMELFDAGSGTYRRAVALPTQDIGQNWFVRDDTSFVALHMARSLVGTWQWRDDTMRGFAPAPGRFRGTSGVLMEYGVTELAPRGKGFMLQIPGEPGLDEIDSAGTWKGGVVIPAARRRGQPPDLLARQRKLTPANPNQVLASASAGVHLRADGNYEVVYVDMEMLGNPSHGGRYGNYRVWVSLLSSDLSRACVDGAVPIHTDATPIPIFSADTLRMLGRAVTSDNHVHSTLYGYDVSSANCSWQPTGGLRPDPSQLPRANQ